MIYDLQKASIWKRISAYIFDMILFGILAVGLAFLISMLLGYDSYTERLDKYSAKYESEYGVDFGISSAEYEALSGAELEQFDEAYAAFAVDRDVSYVYGMILSLTLVMITFGILLSYLILEFAVPLIFKNGQTLGKKIFGIGVMRIDGVKISAPILFIRTVLGKYTLETMVPVLILILIYFGIMGIGGIVIIGALLLTQIIMLAATRTNSAIHDMISSTVTVDFASQMIFDSREAMLEYKKKLHAEEAARADG